MEGMTVVVLDEICYIFQKHKAGIVRTNETGNLKKEIASFIVKSLLFATYRKSLAWKSCGDNIN